MRLREVALYGAQLISAAIMGYASVTKFLSTPGNVFIFTEIGMEPVGRYLIAIIELCAALALLTKSFPALGALLAIGTMCGAAIAHATFLGASVQGDGGVHIVLLLVVVCTSGPVLILRRHTLPFIGPTL